MLFRSSKNEIIPEKKSSLPALKGEMENIQFAPQGVSYQRAALAAQLAFEAAGRGELLSCFELDAFYLRKPQAEREYESRNKL